MTRIFIPVLILFLVNSCAYNIETLTTTDNKKVRARLYKNFDRQEIYENKIMFKRLYSKMTFEKYNGKIHTDTFNGFRYFQYDSVRIYIDNVSTDINQSLKYAELFQTGLLFPKIIACALNDFCLIPQDSFATTVVRNDTVRFTGKYMAFDSSFFRKTYNWTGSKIYISKIKELNYLEKKTTKVFELEHKIYYGGPTDIYYYLEITNDTAVRSASFSEFIKGARVTFLKYSGTAMEI